MKKTTPKPAEKPRAAKPAEKPRAAKPAEKPRVTRAKPAREHPSRDPGTALRPPPPPSDDATAAVDSAYAVLDEHLQRGRDAARARSPQRAEAEDPAPGADPARLLLRAVADTWQAWAGLFGPVATRISQELRGREGVATKLREALAPEPEVRFSDDDRRWREVRPSFLPDAPTNEPVRKAKSSRAAVRVSIEVGSARRFVARVELTHERAPDRLGVEDLVGPGGACIRGFGLEPDDDGGMLLRGDVPDHAPAGTYVAKVRERASRRECGLVTLVVRG
ncbi:MAG: hypothetical protein U0325_31945 [Polyangiales bacterium]